MKASFFNFALILTAFLLSAGLSGQQSTFDEHDEGWRVAGDAQGPSIIPNYDSVGGNPGGYCWAKDDVTGDYWYWVAPDTFLGNHVTSFGLYLRFDLKQSDSSSQGANRADVILEGNGIKLYYNAPNPGTHWSHYDVLLDTIGWVRNTYPNGSPVTRNDFRLALSNITKLHIRGEYRLGPDIGSIDNVILEPLISAVPEITRADLNWSVFPNPCISWLTVVPDNQQMQPATLVVYSAGAKVVFQQAIENREPLEIDVSAWMPGVYVLQWRSRDGWSSSKTIVKI